MTNSRYEDVELVKRIVDTVLSLNEEELDFAIAEEVMEWELVNTSNPLITYWADSRWTVQLHGADNPRWTPSTDRNQSSIVTERVLQSVSEKDLMQAYYHAYPNSLGITLSAKQESQIALIALRVHCKSNQNP